MPRSSIRRPVGSMPWNGAPVNVPSDRHWTAATSSSAVIRMTVISHVGHRGEDLAEEGAHRVRAAEHSERHDVVDALGVPVARP